MRHPQELQLYAVRPAQVAELVDALASGASVLKDVRVRVSPWAPIKPGGADLAPLLRLTSQVFTLGCIPTIPRLLVIVYMVKPELS